MLSERLKLLRAKKDISQAKLANILLVSQQTIGSWEVGRTEPSSEQIVLLARFFGVSIDYLLGNTSEIRNASKKNILRIPVYGTIPAGVPMEAIEDILDYEEVPIDWSNGGQEYFALKLKGDSMYPKYLEGDIVIFRKSPDCDSGQECAIIINGNDATFKKVFIDEKGITLQPINHEYAPSFYTNKQVFELPIRILGVGKEIRRSV